jgi:hypothetical protein
MLRRAVAVALALACVAVAVWLPGPAPTPAEAQAPPPPTATATRTATPTRTATVTATATPTATVTSTPGPWPIFQHDPRHTGRSQFSGPARVGQLWSQSTGSSPLTGSPLVGGQGDVYVGAGGYLYAFSSGGAPLWRLPVGTTFGTALQAPDGTLYATGARTETDGVWNTVYQVEVDGTVLSRHRVPGSLISPLALALGPDGTVYFGVGNTQGTGGVLYALTPNPTTGAMAVRWQRNTGFLAGSQPAVDPLTGVVYVGSYDVGGSVYAFAPSGTQLWRSEPLGYINSSPSIDTDGTIYVGAATGLYAINPNGLVRWVHRTGAPINYSTPAIDVDGNVYVGAGDALLSVDRLGALRWRQVCLPGGRVNSSAAISADGLVFYQAIAPGGIPSAALCATDTGRDASIRWAHITQYNGENGPQVASPAIGGDGLIYVGAPDGVVLSLVAAPVDPTARLIVPYVVR